jgi:regulator of protease activity HflC (stomatin/prohibitin superfamily)
MNTKNKQTKKPYKNKTNKTNKTNKIIKIMKITNLIVLTMLFSTLLFTGCSRIEPGYVGIKVNQAGSDKGVEEYPVQTGWIFYFPLTTRVYEYPVFQQNVIWCQENTKESPGDESISFNCKGGAGIKADVSMSGKFKQAKVPFVFTKFRAEPSVILHGYLRNEVRDALSRIGSLYDPMDVLSEKRGVFLDEVKREVEKRVGDWWEVDFITFANELKVDDRIRESVNAIIAQKQQTQQAQLKVLQTKAEADQAAAKAEGEKRVKIAYAEGEAESTLKKAKAQAEANDLIAKSLVQNPMVLQSIALDKWDGKLPYVNGAGSIPFINVSPTTK